MSAVQVARCREFGNTVGRPNARREILSLIQRVLVGDNHFELQIPQSACRGRFDLRRRTAVNFANRPAFDRAALASLAGPMRLS